MNALALPQSPFTLRIFAAVSIRRSVPRRETVRGDIDELGVNVVCRWFAKYPDHLRLFPFRDAPDLSADPRSRAHGRSVLAAVGALVAGMRDVAALSSTIDHLAFVHAAKGVKRDMFPALARKPAPPALPLLRRRCRCCLPARGGTTASHPPP